MRRIITWLAACAILVSSVGIRASAAEMRTPYEEAGGGESGEAAEDSGREAAGNLELALRFACPVPKSGLSGKEIKVSLLDRSGQIIHSLLLTEELGGAAGTEEIGGRTVTVESSFLNESGAELTTEDLISCFRLEYGGLALDTPYTLKLEGKGYQDFTSEEITLTDYSRLLAVNTSSSSFSLGDVNLDNAVNGDDLQRVESALQTDDGTCDINGDGIVDIADLSMVHRLLYARGEAEIFDTQLIAQRAAEFLTQNVNVTGGRPEDIFSPEGSVRITGTGEDAGEVTIPINFENSAGGSAEMEQIEILSPQVDGAVLEGYARVFYDLEDGGQGTELVEFSNEMPEGVLPIYREAGENRVVISLGRLVAVKHIDIVVTRVQGSENAGYAVVQEIRFLKDIVPENPDTDSAVPKSVTAEAGDGQVKLSWKPAPNVEGYLIRYGQNSGDYTEEAVTEETSVVIEGLKNLETYFFAVYSTSGEWRSGVSAEVSATPVPASVPLPPGGVSVESADRALRVSWGKAKNSTGYIVYYKEKTAESFTRAFEEPLEHLTCTIDGLENGVGYVIYVTAVNSVGESRPSLYAEGAPEAEQWKEPEIPTLRRIDSGEIAGVVMANKNNVAMDQYPDGFSVNNVIDGDYRTHWTARVWWESTGFTYEFKDGVSHDMDYLVYVPRLDGAYRKSISRYKIITWDEEGNKTLETTGSGPSLDIQSRQTGFAILTFPMVEKVHKIYVEVRQWDGSPTNVSLSEIAFYDYYPLEKKIAELFTDSSYTALAPGVTEARIAALEAEAGDAEGYFVNREILLDELALARSLYEGRTDGLGKVMDGIESRNTAGDIKAVNTFQPLGVVANAGAQLVVYAGIPEGEEVSLVPTQYFAEAASWAGPPITLKNGRNIITMPALTSVSGEKGGALYLKYAGERADEIRLQVRGAVTQIPVLELADFESMTERQAREAIRAYVQSLTDYYTNSLKNNMGSKPGTYIRNSTEISLPNVLLSLPADQVYAAVSGAGSAVEDRVQRVYDNVLAWKDLIGVLYRTHGIDDPSAEHSRQNIRYMRMSGGAFMYASGEHIGIGYGSAAALMQGRPVGATGAGNANSLFGWGIAHEIGHVLDTLGRAEITNNIYSLYGQTYDGNTDCGISRLESSGKYEQIFRKTALGLPGASNDVFVALGMYWQLHLAYDGAGDNFYNLVNKAYRRGVGAGLERDDRFAVAASSVAGRDLTEFFTRWGVNPGREARELMAQYAPEEREIWYLSDRSRRMRLSGGETGVSGSPEVRTQRDGRTVKLTISGMSGTENLQGYEISRNGRVIGFTTTGTYEDHIGSANNISVEYMVRAIDVLGKEAARADSGAFLFQVNNLIPRNTWSSSERPDGSWLITFNGENIAPVSGIYVKGGGVLHTGLSVSGNASASGGDAVLTISGGDGEGPAEGHPADTLIEVSTDGVGFEPVFCREIQVQEEKAYLFYRGEDNGSVGIYDAAAIRITNLPEGLTPDNLEFIAYPGDSISLADTAVGILDRNFRYGDGEGDVLAAGSMIVYGSYTGDPVYNTIQVKGLYQTFEQGSMAVTTEERAVNGQVILFAPVTEGEDMAEIHNGIWIFVPDVQREQELAGGACGLSILPSQIKAELYRTDEPHHADGSRLVSNTLWYMTPEADSMPAIEIQ